MLNVIDDCSRYSLALEVDFSLPGERVGRVLDGAAARHYWPKVIVANNRPEFTSKALVRREWKCGVLLLFIEPDILVQNGFVEASTASIATRASASTDSRVSTARAVLADWGDDYNHLRPLSSHYE
ncbi:MAG: transposase [Polyangiaceae bacterium]|nr:transposase [Polyangiaceae bacterium]